jgi:hypothetical protein
MSTDLIDAGFEAVSDDDENEPLVPPGSGCCEEEGVFMFDEDGTLTDLSPSDLLLDLAPRPEPIRPVNPLPLIRPCSRTALKGSWLLSLVPTGPHLAQAIRGPMRIEVAPTRLRVSGDVYVRSLFRPPVIAQPVIAEPFIPGSLVIKKNWYPAFPQSEYRWYFRSLGVTYASGTLMFKFERHLWSTSLQEFVSQDTGSMKLKCQQSLIRLPGAPQPTLQMNGTAAIGGAQFNVTATKTSPYYRGCLVEVDVMTNRQWPATAQSCDGAQTFTFTGVYRATGMDFHAVVNELNLPEDPLLTVAEMHNLLATHRSLSAGGDNWHVWLLVGSRMDGTLGLMFDTGNPPHREGAVGFFDPTLSDSDLIHVSARGKKLGEVPLAFLRTLIHEAGHAFNLFHPKHDVHKPPIGTTIMNQTGDVIGFATTSNPYPCNATMAFNDHNQTSLAHSPDPQVKPGWKEFGWGHGSVFGGIAEPVDVAGLDEGPPPLADLRLDLELPSEVQRGEFVWATVTVTNADDVAQDVTAGLNLAEDDLRIRITTPAGDAIDARDVVLVCSERRMVTLQPGESIAGQVQLFYTPHGLTFDQPGRYVLAAELDVGDRVGSVVRSGSREILVRPAISEPERDLERMTMDRDVGLSLALGDYGTDEPARERLASVVERFAETDTGAACAMVLHNSLARDLRDPRTNSIVRSADTAVADRALDAAVKGRDATRVVRLATAVVSPRDVRAPLLERVQTRIRRARRGTYGEDDVALANKLMSDHLA